MPPHPVLEIVSEESKEFISQFVANVLFLAAFGEEWQRKQINAWRKKAKYVFSQAWNPALGRCVIGHVFALSDIIFDIIFNSSHSQQWLPDQVLHASFRDTLFLIWTELFRHDGCWWQMELSREQILPREVSLKNPLSKNQEKISAMGLSGSGQAR